MRLVELDPRWLTSQGKRIGFIFKCPNKTRSAWWLTCFAEATPYNRQYDAVIKAIGDDFNWLPCKEIAWTIAGGIATATFETLSATPSLDAGETLWHGYITNGEIVGGLH